MQLSRHVAPSALFSFLLLIAPATYMSARQPSQPPQQSAADSTDNYTLSVNPRLVVLDVIVTDKQGNLVTNLKKEDFEVQEDKQPQRIDSFEAPTAHDLPPNVTIHSTEELNRLAPNAPATIIVLDEYSERFEDMGYARISINKYLKAQPQLLPQPTMLMAADIDHLMVLHDYTQDRDTLLQALAHHLPDSDWRYGPNSSLQHINQDASWGHAVLHTADYSLKQIAQKAMEHPGRKNVIWVGHGLYAGANTPQNVRALLQSYTNLLLSARITLYQLDPRGFLGVPVYANKGQVAAGSVTPFEVSFAQLAHVTGGRWFFNRNDVETEIDTSMRDGNESYTLSYIPTSGNAEGAFRDIHIVMKNPNLLAATRAGYYEPGWQVVKNRSTYEVDSMLIDTKKVSNDIPLSLVLTDTPGEVAVQIGSKALPWLDNGPGQPRTAKIRLSCGAFDKQGKMLAQEGIYTEATSPATTPETPQDETVEFSVDCATNPAAVRLCVVVQATDSDKIGAANLNLEAKWR